MEELEPPFTNSGKEYKTVELPGSTKCRHSTSAPRDPPESRTELQANTGTQLFTVVQVPKVKNKPCVHPQMNGLNRICTLCMKEHYPAMMRKDALTQAETKGSLKSSRRVKEVRPGNHVLFDSIHVKQPGKSTEGQKATRWSPRAREMDGQWLLNGPGCPFRGMSSSGIGWWCLGTIWNVLHASELHILKWLK